MAWAGLFAATACGNLFGVGELTADGAPIGGSGQGSGGDPAPSRAGSAASDAGSPTSVGGGAAAGTRAVSSDNPAGAGGAAGLPGGASDAGTSSGATDATADAGAAGSDPGVDPLPPSCRDLDVLCGTAASARDCCATSEISGGSFLRSYDKIAGAGWDDPGSPATIATFRLDVYEVTVGRFRRFVEQYASGWSSGDGAVLITPTESGWREEWSAFLPRDSAALMLALESCAAPGSLAPTGSTWTAIPDMNEALPINCVTWYEAVAFCAWDGGRLPTEAEWNYAAAGGAEARVYPWPSTELTEIDTNHAVYDGPIAPVGSKSLGQGRFGQADLAGNVWEWTMDWYRAPYRTPCDNCAELTQEPGMVGRVLRGGGYYNMPAYLRAAERGNAVPSARDPGYGFRCARNR